MVMENIASTGTYVKYTKNFWTLRWLVTSINQKANQTFLIWED